MVQNSASRRNAKNPRMKGTGRAVLQDYLKDYGFLQHAHISVLCNKIKALDGHNHIEEEHIVEWFARRRRGLQGRCHKYKKRLPSPVLESAAGDVLEDASSPSSSIGSAFDPQEFSQDAVVTLSNAGDSPVSCLLSREQSFHINTLISKPHADPDFLQSLAILFNVPVQVILLYLPAFSAPQTPISIQLDPPSSSFLGGSPLTTMTPPAYAPSFPPRDQPYPSTLTCQAPHANQQGPVSYEPWQDDTMPSEIGGVNKEWM